MSKEESQKESEKFDVIYNDYPNDSNNEKITRNLKQNKGITLGLMSTEDR
jgi:hypothetical protein